MNLLSPLEKDHGGWHRPLDMQRKPAVQQMLAESNGLHATSLDKEPSGVKHSPSTIVRRKKTWTKEINMSQWEWTNEARQGDIIT